MSRMATYHTTVAWKGGHRGHLVCGNGAEMDFSAPPDAHGHAGVMTPEDAFVAAANTCVMMMFLWACERFKIPLVSYECRAEGTKVVELDRTELFTRIVLRPKIRVKECDEARVRRALQSAQKYSLVANSIKSELIIEPEIIIHPNDIPGGNMLSIKVLGPGCENCVKVEQIARKAVAMLGEQANIEKVTAYPEIQKYRIHATPGLVVNERVVCAGRIPSEAEVTTWIVNALAVA